MDSFVYASKSEKPDTRIQHRRKRGIWDREIHGNMCRDQRHGLLHLFTRSYEQVCSFMPSCSDRTTTHLSSGNIIPSYILEAGRGNTTGRGSISFIESDSKGIYFASVSTNGCLSVIDFGALYGLHLNHTQKASEKVIRSNNEAIIDIYTHGCLDVVRWNPTFQDEVGCVAERMDRVSVFDISYCSSKPFEVLKRTPKVKAQEHIGFSDLAFSSSNKNIVFACGLDGALHQWDRRAGKFSCSVLSVSCSSNQLSSLQITSDEQVAFVGSTNGSIYALDIRGGKSSSTFQFLSEIYQSTLFTLKLSSLLENISPLKAQTNIVPSGIHSINIDRSSPFQLAFHLNNGWSGVVNTSLSTITHIHCPPPPWLHEDIPVTFHKRRPTWLATDSIYAVGSSLGAGMNILDFNPHQKSACSVDYDCDWRQTNIENLGSSLNKYVQCSSCIISCASHPCNSSILGGTNEGYLILVEQTTGPAVSESPSSSDLESISANEMELS